MYVWLSLPFLAPLLLCPFESTFLSRAPSYVGKMSGDKSTQPIHSTLEHKHFDYMAVLHCVQLLDVFGLIMESVRLQR